MISDPKALAEFLTRISCEPRIALDTEADSLHAYNEKLCLVQTSVPGLNEILDPLSELDIQPFFKAIESKRLILHGADYDLRLICRSFAFSPTDLIDTMIAARLCGFQDIGLAALVKKFLGIKLSKASQKANWAIRPLSHQMLEYAMNDTRYLLDLSDHIVAELHRLGRWNWFTESRDRMVASAQDAKPRDVTKAWRIPGSSRLSPRAQSVLRVLWQWRETEARDWNRPAFHVMSNADLIQISEKIVKGEPFSTPRMSSRRRKSLEIILALALGIPESEWPQPPKNIRRRPSHNQSSRLQQLRRLRDRKAAELSLDPAILAPRQAMEAIVENLNSDALMNWQREILELPPLPTPPKT